MSSIGLLSREALIAYGNTCGTTRLPQSVYIALNGLGIFRRTRSRSRRGVRGGDATRLLVRQRSFLVLSTRALS